MHPHPLPHDLSARTQAIARARAATVGAEAKIAVAELSWCRLADEVRTTEQLLERALGRPRWTRSGGNRHVRAIRRTRPDLLGLPLTDERVSELLSGFSSQKLLDAVTGVRNAFEAVNRVPVDRATYEARLGSGQSDSMQVGADGVPWERVELGQLPMHMSLVDPQVEQYLAASIGSSDDDALTAGFLLAVGASLRVVHERCAVALAGWGAEGSYAWSSPRSLDRATPAAEAQPAAPVAPPRAAASTAARRGPAREGAWTL